MNHPAEPLTCLNWVSTSWPLSSPLLIPHIISASQHPHQNLMKRRNRVGCHLHSDDPSLYFSRYPQHFHIQHRNKMEPCGTPQHKSCWKWLSPNCQSRKMPWSIISKVIERTRRIRRVSLHLPSWHSSAITETKVVWGQKPGLKPD